MLGKRAPSAGRGGAVQGRVGPPAAAAEGTGPSSGPAPLGNTRLAQRREHRRGPGSALWAGPHLCPRRGGWHGTDPAHPEGQGLLLRGGALQREGKQGWGAVDSRSRGSGGALGVGRDEERPSGAGALGLGPTATPDGHSACRHPRASPVLCSGPDPPGGPPPCQSSRTTSPPLPGPSRCSFNTHPPTELLSTKARNLCLMSCLQMVPLLPGARQGLTGMWGPTQKGPDGQGRKAMGRG